MAKEADPRVCRCGEAVAEALYIQNALDEVPFRGANISEDERSGLLELALGTPLAIQGIGIACGVDGGKIMKAADRAKAAMPGQEGMIVTKELEDINEVDIWEIGHAITDAVDLVIECNKDPDSPAIMLAKLEDERRLRMQNEFIRGVRRALDG